MLKNYFTIAWRHLTRNKTLSFINIFGLSIGMAFAMLIVLWIQFERSYNTFHKNIDRIALVKKHTLFNNEKGTQVGVMLPLYDELKANYPNIKRVSRLDWGGHHSMMVGNQKFNKTGHYVDPDFLEMFTHPVIKGNNKTPLQDPNAIVLTESLAKTLFGTNDPIGQFIKMDNKHTVQVSAVVKDVPPNATLSFDFLAPYEFHINNDQWIRDARTDWGNNFLATVVEVKEGISMEAVTKKIAGLVTKKDARLKNQHLLLHPMRKWHLYDEFKNWVNVGGRIEYVRLFGIIGIFVLLIACINFMNLSTARSEKRAREVGIRKAVGSPRKQLIIQFLSESMFTAFLAFLLSLVLVQVLLPYLKDLGFEHIRLDFSNMPMMLSILAVCLFTGLVSGSYPALYLSSFLPVKVLKGVIRQDWKTVSFRKALVVSQFVISIGLIISTVIVFQQINHARNRFTGYDPNNLISLGASEDMKKNFVALKQDLLNTGYFESVAKASCPLTDVYNTWSGFSWDGKDPNSDLVMDVVMTEWDYEKVSGIQFIAGRPFSREHKTDSHAVIINEAALNMIGYKDPVGKTMKYDGQTLTIIGVVKNVVMKNPFEPVPPGVILFNANNMNVVLIRLKQNADLKAALAAMQPIVEKYNPALPFEYTFTDEEFGKKFETEKRVAKLAGIFAGLAIFISCLGLFGLAMFMAERRSKEMSIRKVLGASITNLWMLLSKEFILLVAIACIIASPLALWLMTNWLQQYDYRIDISWWIFAIAGSLAVIIALITVSTQAIRAAIANPVNRLRAE
jgi:putative ABC transport system permease protein